MQTIPDFLNSLPWLWNTCTIDPRGDYIVKNDLCQDFIALGIGEAVHRADDPFPRELLGRLEQVAAPYKGIQALVPLVHLPIRAVFEEEDGTRYADYCCLTNGVLVPQWVAEKNNLPFKPYEPRPVMKEVKMVPSRF